MKILWAIAASLLLFFVVAISLPFLIDLNTYQDRYRPLIEEALNRKVVLQDIRLTVWPMIGARVRGFTVKDDPSFRSGPFASLSSLDIGVKLWPLLRRKIEVEQITLRDPVITVMRNKAGALNISTLGSQAPPQQKPEAPPAEAVEGPLRALALLAVNKVAIDGGQLTYQDISGSVPVEYTVRDLELVLTAVHLGETPHVQANATVHPYNIPFKMEGHFGPLTESLDIKQFEFQVGLDQTSLLLTGRAMGGSLDATLSSPLIDTAHIPLSLPLTKPVQIKDFHASIHADSPHMPYSSMLEYAEVKDLGLTLLMGPSVVNIKGTAARGMAHITAAASSLNSSDVPVALQLVKPVELHNLHVSARLPYPPQKLAPPLELADIPDFGATVVMGQSQADVQGTLVAGRAKASIVSKGLSTADLPVTIPVRKPVEISGLHAVVEARDQEARVQTVTFEVFGGSVKGQASVGIGAGAPPLHAALALDGLHLNPIVAALAAAPVSLTGTAAAKVSLAGHGRTIPDLMKALDGTGTVLIKDAELEGLNVMRELAALLKIAGLSSDRMKATVFSTIESDLAVKQGVIAIQRLFVDSHDFQATGHGTTAFDQSLNLRLRLTLSPAVSQRITAASPITNVALSNGRLSLPLVIAGTWQNPSYQLDTGMFTAKIQEAGKQKFNEAVQGLLKGTTKPEDLRRQGSDLLKGFLGR